MRDVESRIAWYRNNRPEAVGRCAEHVKNALNAPLIHAASASIAYSKVPPAQMHRTALAPRGAILYWTGGVNGYGHVAISLGSGDVLSVDVNGARTVGSKPMQWFAANWPRLTFKGWSWYWGPLDTQPKESTMAFRIGESALRQSDGDITVTGGQWKTVATITIPDGARYICTLQVRMPKGVGAGEAALGRIGWGSATGVEIDETGHNPIHPASDVRRWRTPIVHEIAGGGPLAYRVWLPAGTHKIRFVAKATRFA